MGTLSKRGIEEFGDITSGSSIEEAGSNLGRTLEAEATRGPQSDAEHVRSAQLVDENGVEIGHEKAPRTAAGTGSLGGVRRTSFGGESNAPAAHVGTRRGRIPAVDRPASARAASDRSTVNMRSATGTSANRRSSAGSIPVSDQSDLGALERGIAAPQTRSGIAHQVERVMAGVPTSTWITLAGVSMIGSFALRLFGRRASANLFTGWAPMFLVAGLYNKLTTVGAATALLSSRR